MSSEYKSIKYEVSDRIGKITMTVPEKMNALDERLSDELASAFAEAENDDNVKVVVLTGSGPAFCAGGDMSIFPKLTLEQGVAGVTAKSNLVVGAFSKLPKPVIAAVNGYAVGAGMSMALASDIIIASDKAVFGAAFVNIGLVPDLAWMYYMPKLVGLQKAKELAFTGKNITAQEALSLGIVNSVVEADKFEEAVAKTAGALARQPRLAMASAKAILNTSFETSMSQLITVEGIAQGACIQSEDCKEGVDAFFNKRKPNFK
jgi:2-(1,2-epoxy-1,2-dihydrophenyl)acetyl-CoA isomerase